jgi:sugar phosphate isomerase/epimerase
MKTLMNRRALLGTGAAAVAAVCVSRGVAETVVDAPMAAAGEIRLGLASYTFRNFERAKVIGFMKQLRLTRLNCKDVKDHLPSTSVAAEEAAIADYKAAGITLTAGGNMGFPKDDDGDMRAKFEYAKRAGLGVIVCDPEVAVLPRLEKFVKEYDIKVAIHNHGPEHKVFHSPADVLKYIGKMDARMGCCIDIGHTMRAGMNPVDAIRLVGPRLFDVHTKDLAKADAKDSQVAVGEGILPIRGIFAELMKIGYKGNVDLEYEIHADDPMPGVIESFGYMRGVLAGMKA